jgi:hypothetical protein
VTYALVDDSLVGTTITVLESSSGQAVYTQVESVNSYEVSPYQIEMCLETAHGVYALCGEGVAWIRGLHKDGSEAMLALRAASCLVRGE